MKFRVPVKAIHPAYTAALAAASKGSLQPLLRHVLCRVSADGVVTLEGGDGLRGVVARVEGVEVQAEGSAVLDLKLDGLLRANGDSVLSVEAGESATAVRFERQSNGRTLTARHSLPAVDPQQYPSVAGRIAAAEPVARLPVGELLTLVRRVRFAASDDMAEGKSQARGVLVQTAGGRLHVASMQPQVSAAAEAVAVAEVVKDLGGMFPANSLTLLGGVLPKGEEPVEVRMSASGLVVLTKSTDVWVTAMHAPLLDLGKLFPAADRQPVCRWSDAWPLLEAVAQAAVTTSDDRIAGFLTLDHDGGVVRTSAPESGASEVPFDLPEFDGQRVEVPFNTAAILRIAGGLRKEDSVSAEIHQMGAFLRLVLRYGTTEAGGRAALVQMTERE